MCYNVVNNFCYLTSATQLLTLRITAEFPKTSISGCSFAIWKTLQNNSLEGGNLRTRRSNRQIVLSSGSSLSWWYDVTDGGWGVGNHWEHIWQFEIKIFLDYFCTQSIDKVLHMPNSYLNWNGKRHRTTNSVKGKIYNLAIKKKT